MLNLKEKYKKEVVPKMMEKFSYKNKLAVPRVEKVVVNTGFGRMIIGKTSQESQKIISTILNDLALICGQKPILTKAKKSVSGFKIRKGMDIGAKVTLRGKKMYDFLDRLINIALPRSRDFKGIDLDSFDRQGNLNIAIREHIIFPEVSFKETKIIFGFEITIKTITENREKGIELLRLLSFPIKTKTS